MDNGAQYSESLARLRTRTIEQCLEAQRRTGRRLVFAFDTALSLQGIELPRYRRGGLLADTLHAVIESNGVRTILQGICFVLWSGPQTHMPIHHGRLRCTDSVTTWAMHANRLEDEELVVLGDSMMRRDGHMKKATLEEFRIYVDSLSDLSNYSGSDRLRAVRGVSKCVGLSADAGEYRFFPGNEKSNCSVALWFALSGSELCHSAQRLFSCIFRGHGLSGFENHH